jgi:acetolactate synthase I/II/III large subunit
MNGAELLVKTAVASGVEVCFANAGTTEIPIVTALDSIPGIRVYLGLFEGVCTGAADGYGRMLDKPAMTLLHLGPGLANGIANLHNARRGNSPVWNVIGEHASWHVSADPPLAMDIESLARTVSGWWRTCQSSGNIAEDVAEAIAASRLEQVATLIVPNDFQLAECKDHPPFPRGIPYNPIDVRSIESIASRLKRFQKTALLLGRRALRKPGLDIASRIQKAIGCDLLTRALPGCIDRGAGLPDIMRLPHFPDEAVKLLSGYEAVLLAGSTEPVTFFGYPGVRSRILSEEQEKITLCTDRQNVVEALECLAEALKAPLHPGAGKMSSPQQRLSLPEGDLTPEKACLTLAALQPENAIIVDEAVSSGHFHYPLTAGLPPHSILMGSGGSIGQGIPCATGAAIACPNRPVINLEADGSALYTIQALWTQAHEGSNVTTLICSNRSYRILQMELARAGIKSYGEKTRALTELTRPPINWVKTAEGFGVPGVTVSTAEELARQLRNALAEPGPHLIEMLLP